MDGMNQFRENLNLLLQIAETQERRLTREQIQGCFEDLALTEEQWELIYHYLEMNQVEVEYHERKAAYASRLAGTEETEPGSPDREPDEREMEFFRMYLDELAEILPLSEEEERMLAERMLAGDPASRERLTEGKLALAARIAWEYVGRGLGEADLVQESNLALMLALSEYEAGPLDPFLECKIRRTLEEVLAEACGMGDVGSYLAGQANDLLKASTELAEELGREATVEELSARLRMPEDRIREIMKMSLDAVSVIENGNLE